MCLVFSKNEKIIICEENANNRFRILGRGGMGAKIEAALGAVRAGSKCNACVVVGGDDLNAVMSLVGRKHNP